MTTSMAHNPPKRCSKCNEFFTIPMHAPVNTKKCKCNDIKEDLFIDMDGVLVDYDLAVEGLSEEEAIKTRRTPGFFKDLKPMENAIWGFHKLAQKYNVYILSTPSWSTPTSWTEKVIWTDRNIGSAAEKKIILCHNKGLFKGRALIDDRTVNGVEEFKGEHIHFGCEKFPDWKAVLEYLL